MINMTGKLLIMYGTETGNSEYLAMDAEKLASEHGMDVQVNAMDELSVDEISKYENVVIVCSTWGDGEQPDNAQELFDDFTDSPDGCMEGVNFAVLALGDSAFDMFCQSGIEWDEIFEKKGGNRVNKRIDCDTDYEDYAEEWIDETLKLMKV